MSRYATEIAAANVLLNCSIKIAAVAADDGAANDIGDKIGKWRERRFLSGINGKLKTTNSK